MRSVVDECAHTDPGASAGIDLDSDLIVELAASCPNLSGVKLSCVIFSPRTYFLNPLYSVSSIDAQVLESSRESRLLSPIRRLIKNIRARILTRHFLYWGVTRILSPHRPLFMDMALLLVSLT